MINVPAATEATARPPAQVSTRRGWGSRRAGGRARPRLRPPPGPSSSSGEMEGWGQDPDQCPHPEPGRLPWRLPAPSTLRVLPGSRAHPWGPLCLPVCPSGVCLPAPLVLAWDSRRVRVHLLHVISDPCPWAGLTSAHQAPSPGARPPSPAWSRHQVEGQGRWVQLHLQFRV